MRIGIASGFGCSLSWAARLRDEGHEVRLWIDRGKSPRGDDLVHVGDGLITKEQSYFHLIEWMQQYNDALLLFDASGMGERADRARSLGIPVVGGGTFMDKLEKDRLFGQKIAEDAGCMLPDFKEFDSLSACAAWAPSLDREVYFKSDAYIDSDATHKCEDGQDLIDYLGYLKTRTRDKTRCVIQDKIPGIALSTARWWNGTTWVGPYESTIEHKALMNDDIGPSTGCSFNAVWFYPQDNPQIAQALCWDDLTTSFRARSAPPGIYDINAIVADDGDAYFLEWTPRLGYDSEMTSARLIDNLGDFLQSVGTGSGYDGYSQDIAYSVRLSVPPYPWEHSDYADKRTCVGTPVFDTDGLWDGNFIAYQVRANEESEGALELASPEGIVGLSLATGSRLKRLGDETLDFAKQIRCPGLQYRTDGHECAAEDAKKVAAAGYEIHEGLVK